MFVYQWSDNEPMEKRFHIDKGKGSSLIISMVMNCSFSFDLLIHNYSYLLARELFVHCSQQFPNKSRDSFSENVWWVNLTDKITHTNTGEKLNYSHKNFSQRFRICPLSERKTRASFFVFFSNLILVLRKTCFVPPYSLHYIIIYIPPLNSECHSE